MSKKVESLMDVLTDELRDIYSAENQILKALPKMAKSAESEGLKEAFNRHLEETQRQVQRLEQIGEQLKIKLSGKTCEAMKGLLKEGEEVLKKEGEPALIDCMLVGAAQRVEHYEIAAYGTARALAEALGEDSVATLLQETLDEESAADEKLSTISEEELLPGLAEEADESADGSEEEEEDEDSEDEEEDESPRPNTR